MPGVTACLIHIKTEKTQLIGISFHFPILHILRHIYSQFDAYCAGIVYDDVSGGK